MPFYARALTPADYGILDSLATFSFLISAIIQVGLDSASGYYFFEEKTEKGKGEILFTNFILNLLTFIPILIISFFSKNLSCLFYNSPSYTWLIMITCINIPLNFLLTEQSQMYQFLKKPWRYNIITILKSLFNIGIGIFLVVLFKYGILGAQIATIVSTVIVLIYSIITFTYKRYVFKFRFDIAKKMIKFGFPLIWAGLGSWIYVSSDRFFLLHYSNLNEMGYYSIGNTFSQPQILVNMAFQASFGVIFLALYNEEQNNSKINSKVFAINSLNLFFILSVSLTMFLSIFSTIIIKFVTTSKYIRGSIALPFLCFSQILGQAQQLTSFGLFLSKKTWHYVWLVAAAALSNILLNFYFIPKFGFIGASITTIISYLIYFLLCYFVAQKFIKIDYPLKKLLIYCLISFLLAIFIPFSELIYNINIPFYAKLLMLIFSLLLPFLIKLVDFNDLVTLYHKSTIVNRH